MDLRRRSDRLAGAVLAFDRWIGFEVVAFILVFGLLRVLATPVIGARARRRFPALADRLGFRDGEAIVDVYRVQAAGDYPTIDLIRPALLRAGAYAFARDRDDVEHPDLIELRSGRRPLDVFFAQRLVSTGMAAAIAADPSRLDCVVQFVKRWGTRLRNCRITHEGITVTFTRGHGSGGSGYMPLGWFEEMLPDLVDLTRVTEELAFAADGRDRTAVLAARQTGAR